MGISQHRCHPFHNGEGSGRNHSLGPSVGFEVVVHRNFGQQARQEIDSHACNAGIEREEERFSSQMIGLLEGRTVFGCSFLILIFQIRTINNLVWKDLPGPQAAFSPFLMLATCLKKMTKQTKNHRGHSKKNKQLLRISY